MGIDTNGQSENISLSGMRVTFAVNFAAKQRLKLRIEATDKGKKLEIEVIAGVVYTVPQSSTCNFCAGLRSHNKSLHSEAKDFINQYIIANSNKKI
ncbi:MAG: PilZ domain-containing protein [Pseudomonadales bacterium]